jgi:hypothetical protein
MQYTRSNWMALLSVTGGRQATRISYSPGASSRPYSDAVADWDAVMYASSNWMAVFKVTGDSQVGAGCLLETAATWQRVRGPRQGRAPCQTRTHLPAVTVQAR